MSSAPPVAPARTNVMAIVAFVAAFVVPIAAIVLGALARREVVRTGEEGEGLARAGLILGIVFTAIQVIFFIVWLGLFLGVFVNAVVEH